MFTSDLATIPLDELVDELTVRCDEILANGDLDLCSDVTAGKGFAVMARLVAAKAQAGSVPSLSVGNHPLCATDGVIASTMLLEAVNVEVFELSAWQALSSVGSKRKTMSRSLRDAE